MLPFHVRRRLWRHSINRRKSGVTVNWSTLKNNLIATAVDSLWTHNRCDATIFQSSRMEHEFNPFQIRIPSSKMIQQVDTPRRFLSIEHPLKLTKSRHSPLRGKKGYWEYRDRGPGWRTGPASGPATTSTTPGGSRGARPTGAGNRRRRQQLTGSERCRLRCRSCVDVIKKTKKKHYSKENKQGRNHENNPAGRSIKEHECQEMASSQ